LFFFSLFSTVTAHLKTSYALSETTNTAAVRFICRPTVQTSSLSLKVAASSYPTPSPTSTVEQEL